MELVIVLVLALIILGPKRIPDAGKAIGKGMRGFKESLSGITAEDDDNEELTSSPAASPARRA